MNDFTFNVLKIVVAIATIVITSYLVPYIKNKIEDDKYKKVVELIDVAVHAAEQTMKESGMGKAKKEDVVNFIGLYLMQHGLNMSEKEIDKYIEAAVFDMNSKKE